MRLTTYFRKIAPSLEDRWEWDEEDCNVANIDAAAERLTQSALDRGTFESTPAAEISDAAYEYVTRAA